MRLTAVFCLIFILFSCTGTKQEKSNKENVPQDENPYPIIRKAGVVANIESQDNPEYPVSNLIDRTWKSWSPDWAGGASFILVLKEKTTVNGFAFKNGYSNFDVYNQYGRVKTFKVFADGEPLETIRIKDSMSFEQYSFRQPVNCVALRFQIDDIYLGTDGSDFNSARGTHISEIALLNRPVSDNELYENIISWLFMDELHDSKINSVTDIDKISLLDYLPFNIPGYSSWATKIALLDGQSSLKLNDNLPCLDGATAMYPLYSAFVHAVYPEKPVDPFLNNKGILIIDDYVKALYKWGYFPNADMFNRWRIAETERNNFTSIVQCNTTSTAYRRLIDGETDIVFCYEPSQAEIDAAAAKGKRFNMTPVAKDAFVFIVNEKNALNNITTKQIRDIYSGKVSNWKSISSVDEPIIPYQRSENSGSQSTLQSIMKGSKLIRPILGGEYLPNTMSGMVRTVVSDFYNYNAAIGYTFLFYLNNMAGSTGTKVLSVDGATPNAQNLRNGAYPFTQTVYAVTTGNESENTKKFIEWILSAQGQELVVKTGYTPVR
jgi:phosphate transport system substrate-binding protein